MPSNLLPRYILRETLGLLSMALALFWPAGRIDWLPAWAALAVTAAWVIATAAVILRYNPALLTERLGPRKGAPSWDVAILGLLGLVQLFRYILAGLDQRYGWTGGFPFAAQMIALVICALGYALFVWAIATNAFFSQVVRLQSERGHTVVSTGPYRYLRHPAYLGAILYELAVPILLGSWWAMIPSSLSTILLVLRTALEDRFLRRELSGYLDYSHQVPHRLLPGLW
jgi:protein-S-isoprenylcysteine O-methyltransferase Ste14